jgi:NhaB family Na+:H+ antiporter
MTSKLGSAFLSNFLGQSPKWYKQLILAFLIINPIVLSSVGMIAISLAF